jgi:hypothetical protein
MFGNIFENNRFRLYDYFFNQLFSIHFIEEKEKIFDQESGKIFDYEYDIKDIVCGELDEPCKYEIEIIHKEEYKYDQYNEYEIENIERKSYP